MCKIGIAYNCHFLEKSECHALCGLMCAGLKVDKKAGKKWQAVMHTKLHRAGSLAGPSARRFLVFPQAAIQSLTATTMHQGSRYLSNRPVHVLFGIADSVFCRERLNDSVVDCVCEGDSIYC